MTTPRPDLPHRLAEAWLQAIVQRLVDAGQPPDWSSVFNSAGAFPPAGACDGVVWVRVAQIGPATPGEQLPIGVPGPSGWIIDLEAGALRCASILDEQGNLPDPATLTAEAVRDSIDRYALLASASCDLPPIVDAELGDALEYTNWTPIDPGAVSGGFVVARVHTTNLEGAPA